MPTKDDKSSKSKKSDKKSSKSKDKDAKSDRSKSRPKSAKSDKESKKDADTKSKKSGKSGKSADKKSSASKSKSKDKTKDKDSKKKSSKGAEPAVLSGDEAGEETKQDLNNATLAGTVASHMYNKTIGQGGTYPGGDMSATGGFRQGGGFGMQGEGLFSNAKGPSECALHGKPLKFYCETTESLICYDCTVMGPHNTQLHRIANLDEAFRYRFETLNKTIHESLVPKRAQLIGQIVRLDHRLEEVKTVKGVIERDIRNEYAGISERLKSAEGVKTAVLQHDLSEVQKDITRVDEILMFMEEITTNGPEGGDSAQPDQLAFLQAYRQLNENIEYSVTKQFKVDIDVYPNDLPRELAERQLLLEHYEEQRKLLKFKDDVIWKMSQELKKKYDFYQEEFDKETRHEMNEWARLVDKYSGELKKYDMVCAFCGQHLSDLTVNTPCADSTTGYDGPFFTDEEPTGAMRGRHWFGKPSNRSFEGVRSMGRNSQTNYRCDEFLVANQHMSGLFKRVSEALNYDFVFMMACVNKDEIINAIFEHADTHKIKPAEILTYVGLFGEQNELADFHKVLERFNLSQQPQTGVQGGRSPNPSRQADRDLHNRVKESLMQANGGIAGMETAMRKFSIKGAGDTINQDDLLLAFNKVHASGLSLDDVKEFYNSVKGKDFQTGHQDDFERQTEVNIGEVMQVLRS